eukprot:scaffold1044_cov120-Isochrysis_galbana.AAC.1
MWSNGQRWDVDVRTWDEGRAVLQLDQISGEGSQRSGGRTPPSEADHGLAPCAPPRLLHLHQPQPGCCSSGGRGGEAYPLKEPHSKVMIGG